MSFRLTSIATIGSYQFFGGLHDCVIKRSVKEIVDTAVIEIPAVGRVNTAQTLNSDLPQNSIATSRLWNEGDPVTLQLGYNNQNLQEFKGFVRRVNASIPVKIECEGYAWQLRRKVIVQTWKSVKLRDFLAALVSGTDIKLSPYIPDYLLVNLKANHPNALKLLEYVKDHCHLSVYFLFDVLYVGLEELVPGKVVKHRLGWNTVRDDKLKWRLASDTSLQVRLVTAKGKNAKTLLYQEGDPNGAMVTKKIANITDPKTVSAIAKDLYQQAKYTGFEGDMTGFLQPYIQMCDTEAITDKIYNERTGNYFCQGAEVKFGMQGAQRIIHEGRTLSGAPTA